MSERDDRSRADWQRTTGFALYTDFNETVLNYAGLRIPEITQVEADKTYVGTVPSAANLHIFTQAIVNRVEKTVPISQVDRRLLGINEADYQDARPHTANGGFSDPDFPWQFSAAIAHNVVEVFVENGVISNEERNALSFGDWADVIGSGWFSDVMHDLALTSNGVWNRFGRYAQDYSGRRFKAHCKEKGVVAIPFKQPFAYIEKTEVVDDVSTTYATVDVSRIVVQGLRRKMKVNVRGSVGCPVARKSVRYTREEAAENPHIKALVARGVLREVPERSDDEHVRYMQDQTTIDTTLSFFAMQLDWYDRSFGTPVVDSVEGSRSVLHEPKPKINKFSWPTKERS